MKDKYHCKKTGTCCKMACSEFSYDDLKEKALSGDEFASQFTSVFVPYENKENAREVFPEYYDHVHESIEEGEEVYFYYCPHVSDKNLCTIYEDRPQICRNFPDNPLSILPKCCGYYDWKEEVHITALVLHSLIMITEFYVEKLEQVM